ncbi:unnamed protein product [Pieris brassicae]|uniref:Uncharacterized protein n=1 Tax=Pieris brassicae TaxID=7116 RepID=A0A9P0XFK7_PIEBR|nr:unnamed protein product [Pieris brassicae]
MTRTGIMLKKDQKISFHTQYMQFKHEKARSGKVECRQYIDGLNEEIFSILRDRTNLALPESSEYCYPVNPDKPETKIF